jgi:hypothetical protein
VTSFRDLVELAGGATAPRVGLFVSGIMMVPSVSTWTTRTRPPPVLIVLPRDHYSSTQGRPPEAIHRCGISQRPVQQLSEFSPRYLLGYEAALTR